MFRVSRLLATGALGLLVVASMLGSAEAQLSADGRYKGPLHAVSDPNGSPSFQGINSALYGGQRNGAGVQEGFVPPNIFGDSYGGGKTFDGGPVGYWVMTDLLPGSYNFGFTQGRQFPRKIFFGLDANAKFVIYRNTPDYYSSAYDWMPDPRPYYAQQFQAFGNSVTSVHVRFPLTTEAVVTIHQGDVNGPQIGPARFIRGSFADDCLASWSAGEVPTTPGQWYTAKIVNPDGGVQVMLSRGRSMNGDDYYGGKTWYGTELFDIPIRMVIGMDTDGLITTVNTSNADAKNALVAVTPGIMGQTFTAKGVNVISFDARVLSPYIDPGTGEQVWNDFDVAVFQSPGANGAGVNQIGPTKYVRGINSSANPQGRIVAVWAPGEVPVTPGQQYYIRVKTTPSSPSGFLAAYRCSDFFFDFITLSANEYSGGTAYYGGSPQTYDWACSITEESVSGAALAPKIKLTAISQADFTAPQCTFRGTNTATIQFATPGDSTTALVEYGKEPPYTSSVNSGPAVQHTVNLTGLDPATEYHVRVTVSAPGRQTTRSRDFSFVTEADTPNLLVNPGFETGNLTGWTTFGRTGRIPGIRNWPAGGPVFIGGVTAHTGNYYLGHEKGEPSGQSSYGGVYQRIKVNPGLPVHVKGWVYTYQGDYNQAMFEGAFGGFCMGRISVDPTGGTNPDSFSLIRSAATSSVDWYNVGSHVSRYIDLGLVVQPVGEFITVFVEGGQFVPSGTNTPPSPIGILSYGWDDISVTQPGVTVLNNLGEVDDLPDGSNISIAGLIVTAEPGEAGDYYVESQDRSRGIRVESEDFAFKTFMVDVTGLLSTKPSGERYIRQATFPVQDAGMAIVELTTKNANITQLENKLPNVGLLARTAGTVVEVGADYFTISDGSFGGPLRVNATSSGVTVGVGQMVPVTGIIQLEGANPQTAIAVLRPRSAGDVNVLN